MSEHEQTADILDGAADVIEDRGWIQRLMKSPQGVCLMGGFRTCGLIRGNEAIPTPVLDAMRAALGFEVSGHRVADDLVEWNDAPERTKQEVLDALRLAAKDQRRLADGIES